MPRPIPSLPIQHVCNCNDTTTLIIQAIRVENQSGSDTHYKLKHTTKMEKVFVEYCHRMNITLCDCVFTKECGTHISGSATPCSLGLENQDRIFVNVRDQQDPVNHLFFTNANDHPAERYYICVSVFINIYQCNTHTHTSHITAPQAHSTSRTALSCACASASGTACTPS